MPVRARQYVPRSMTEVGARRGDDDETANHKPQTTTVLCER